MHFDHPLTVSVTPGEALAARPRLFEALESAFPVTFVPASGPSTGADATIVLCEEAIPASRELATAGVPTLAVGGAANGAKPEAVLLHDDEAVDRRLRRIELSCPLDGPPLAAVGEGERVVASAGADAAWTVSDNGPAVHRVRSSLPELGHDQVLRDLLQTRALPVVALVQHLRALTDASSFDAPPLRAVFLFDDPNLRWRTYGFINYEQLLAHADEHAYHAAMAMIPLDGWRTHRATAELFRGRPDRLSLVFHGNDHVGRELMRPTDHTDAVVLAAQAMRRVSRFESRHDLHVERVMTPPHGLCSERTAYALGSVGFDALSAPHPLPWTEQPPADRPLAGWEPATFAGGCAVIPRVTFTTPTSELALRAFLGQPLVLYGHHDDLANGLGLLAETAARVNRLGDVRWTSLGTIAATNCAVRVDGDLARVRPYSLRLRLRTSERPAHLIVDAPRDGGYGIVGWSVAADGEVLPFDSPVPWGRDEGEIVLRRAAEVDPSAYSRSRRLWPVLRRLATETRDRMLALRSAAGSLTVALAAHGADGWPGGFV